MKMAEKNCDTKETEAHEIHKKLGNVTYKP